VILATGLYSSLAKVNQLPNAGMGQVNAGLASAQHGPPPPMTTSQSKTVQAAISAQPGTQRYLAQAIGGEQNPKISMPGLPTTDGLGFRAYHGDSSWLGYQMVRGRWYSAPGQVDVNGSFLTETGLKVGDSFTFSVNSRPVTAGITGQVYYPNTPFISPAGKPSEGRPRAWPPRPMTSPSGPAPAPTPTPRRSARPWDPGSP
jgi:putative ABC transport system permease protein